MRTIKIPSNPSPDQIKRARSADAYPCVICGIPVTKPKFICHEVYGGGWAVHPGDETVFAADKSLESGDLGCQPVGTDCLRRFPEMKPFVFSA